MTDARLVEARQRKRIVLALRRENAGVAVPPGIERIGTPAASLGSGDDGEVHWYADRNVPSLLFRVRWEDGGLWLERHDGGERWVDAPGLLDYFMGHDHGAVELTRKQVGARLGEPR